MDDILQKFEHALTESDLVHVPGTIEQLLKLYVTRSATPELRHRIVALLQRKAAESTNHAFTAYLRAVADCVKDTMGVQTDECVEEHRPIEAKPSGASITPKMTKLGEFLRSQRPHTPIP